MPEPVAEAPVAAAMGLFGDVDPEKQEAQPEPAASPDPVTPPEGARGNDKTAVIMMALCVSPCTQDSVPIAEILPKLEVFLAALDMVKSSHKANLHPD